MSTELLSIRLPDGQIVEWSHERVVAYGEDWTVDLATITPEQWEQGYERLKLCLAHEDGVRCEVCSEDT